MEPKGLVFPLNGDHVMGAVVHYGLMRSSPQTWNDRGD